MGPLCADLDGSWSLCWRSGGVLGLMLAILNRSWAFTGAVRGRSWRFYKRSWLLLGISWGLCWRSWAALGPLLAVLGQSWSRCVRSWAALGTYVGGLEPRLEPMLAVLGRSWGLCWRSRAALGAYVGGLWPKNAKNMATLKTCLFLERGRDLRPGGRS